MLKDQMYNDAKEAIKEKLKDGYSDYYCDLHNEIFNTDYYIIGTFQAKEALQIYGVFDAIEKVQEYEKDNFGEVNTDLSDPEKLVNMLYYIIGEEVISELFEDVSEWEENWNNQATTEVNKVLLKAF